MEGHGPQGTAVSHGHPVSPPGASSGASWVVVTLKDKHSQLGGTEASNDKGSDQEFGCNTFSSIFIRENKNNYL